MTDRMTEVETALAHALNQIEELNSVIIDQEKRIELLEARMTRLRQWAAEQETDKSGGVVIGDEKPPHY